MVFSLFKGPFENAGCTYEQDGWVTTDLQRGERIKWCPNGKQAFRWDVIENRWLPSNEDRNQFLAIARQYQAEVRQKK
jgi:hypothetical protein